MRTRHLSAYRVYLIQQGGTAFAFSLIVTVNLVWQAQAAALSPLELVLVGTVLEATLWSVKLRPASSPTCTAGDSSIVIGVVMMGAGFLIEGLFPRFDAILLAQVIWAWARPF